MLENEQSIGITDFAKLKVMSVIDRESLRGASLRISVAGRSATSFEYALGLELSTRENDCIIEVDENLNLLVDPQSLEYLRGATIDYVENDETNGFKIENPNQPGWSDARSQKIQEVIDSKINPSIAAHGGRIDLVSVEEKSVSVRMTGGCQGCSMAHLTLKDGVSRMLQEAFPEIEEVIDITDHTSGVNPYY